MVAKELFEHVLILEAYRLSLHFLSRYEFDVSLLGEAHEWNQRRGNYRTTKVMIV